MSITTTPVDKYSSDEPLPATTGSDADQQFSRMQARLTARYRLVAVPGRPEELVSPVTTETPQRGVSLGYGCRTIRVRLMLGREWVETRDFQIEEGWQGQLYQMCDAYFGYVTPDTIKAGLAVGRSPILSINTASIIPIPTRDQPTFPTRPIRDNPQA